MAAQSPLVRTPEQWANKISALQSWSLKRKIDHYMIEQTFHVLAGWDFSKRKIQVTGRAFIPDIESQKGKELYKRYGYQTAEQLYDQLAAVYKLPTNGSTLMYAGKAVNAADRPAYMLLIKNGIEEFLADGTLVGLVIRPPKNMPQQLIGPGNIDSPLSKAELVQICRKKGLKGYSHQSKLQLRKVLADPNILSDTELRQLCRLKGNSVSSQASRQELLARCLAVLPDGMYLGTGMCGCVDADFGPNSDSCSLTVPFGQNVETVDAHQLLFLASLVDSSVVPHPSPKNLKKACELVASMQPSKKWLEKQRKYWESLPDMWGALMLDYTKYGDKIVNTFLRGQRKKAVDMYIQGSKEAKKAQEHVIFSLFLVQNFTEDSLAVAGRTILKRRYKGDLQNMKYDMGTWFEPRYFSRSALEQMLFNVSKAMRQIIRGAPKLDKDIVVFRGLVDSQHVKATATVHNDLISTSADYFVAWRFAFGLDATVMHVLLPKGSTVLAMLDTHFGDESEILLPPGTTLVTQQCVEAAESPNGVMTSMCGYQTNVNHCYTVART